MKDREALEFYETRLQLITKSGGRCEVCGEMVTISTAQLAHRVPQNKMNLKLYGKEVIHHPANMAVTCSLYCNSRVSVGSHGARHDETIAKIRQEIDDGR